MDRDSADNPLVPIQHGIPKTAPALSPRWGRFFWPLALHERGRQLRRPYYLRRFRSQASLISKTTIIAMVVTRIGAANIANIVSIM
jgi:hypothetical protein